MVFNESCSVDGKFDDIADLIPSKENVSISGRVLRLWKVPTFLNPFETSTIEMVLVDQRVKVIVSLYGLFLLGRLDY
jgi:hypothetical protein